jgi:hypothetical protein
MTCLNNEGYPLQPTSIFIAVPQELVPKVDRMTQAMREGEEFTVPVRSESRWKFLCGKVTKITIFPDGTVVHYGQIPEKSFIRWPDAVLWIPTTGTCGILNTVTE